MRKLALSLAGILLFLQQIPAGDSQGKIVQDLWDVAYLQGGRAGFVHTVVRESEKNGSKIYSTIVALNLTVKRNKDIINLRMDTGTAETAEGKVVGVFMRQYLGKSKELLISGVVVGKQLRLTLDRTKALEPAPWDDKALGLVAQQRFLAERKAKPGDAFSFKSFEPTVNLVTRIDVQVKEFEDVELLNRTRKRLLRVEYKPEKLEKVQLPALITWVDKQFVPLRQQMEVPGLGKINLFRTTKALALGPAPIATLTDIGIGQYVKLKKRIPRPYDTSQAVYRITIDNDDNPASTFSQDERQQVKNVKGHSFELHVHAGDVSKEGEKEPGPEFRKSSYFINSADATVKQLARQAVGGEKDPWKKAQRIEKWVFRNMKPVNDEAMATADHVAKTLRGDCTEYSMLTAAMCRAQGIPSRTAIGLIYADVPQGPVFAFHMWTEVWIDGRWRAIDATRATGYVGATHLKITDHSWNDTRTLTPLFPLVRVLGRVQIDVISAR
jgi:transglutaminase-like putative cysteine protease